jgi:hypothetical protein
LSLGTCLERNKKRGFALGTLIVVDEKHIFSGTKNFTFHKCAESGHKIWTARTKKSKVLNHKIWTARTKISRRINTKFGQHARKKSQVLNHKIWTARTKEKFIRPAVGTLDSAA